MENKLVGLREMGCDMEGAMSRFLDDKEFYFECYNKALTDDGFEKLREALEKKDARESFEYAHALKGVVANLGLTSLLDKISEIVEPLRFGQYEEGLMEKYEAMMQEREKYLSLVF